MSEWDTLKSLEMVKAPPDFEQKVMSGLSLRKGLERRRRTLALRWTMAGSFASLAAVAVLLNIFVFQGPNSLDRAGEAKGSAARSSMVQRAGQEQMIPIIETLDYRTEMRSRSAEPEAVYLLEQVSDTAPLGIKY